MPVGPRSVNDDDYGSVGTVGIGLNGLAAPDRTPKQMCAIPEDIDCRYTLPQAAGTPSPFGCAGLGPCAGRSRSDSSLNSLGLLTAQLTSANADQYSAVSFICHVQSPFCYGLLCCCTASA
jgi:hypothetical protein